jgi:very-short-patch-repair endonuclease
MVVPVTRRARQLRHQATDAERLLWSRLRGRQLNGCKFRHQHPVGPFIADFVCLEKLLIIEVDGGQHADAKDYDKQRSYFLANKGFRVVRYWNIQVLTETTAIVEDILGYLLSPP